MSEREYRFRSLDEAINTNQLHQWRGQNYKEITVRDDSSLVMIAGLAEELHHLCSEKLIRQQEGDSVVEKLEIIHDAEGIATRFFTHTYTPVDPELKKIAKTYVIGTDYYAATEVDVTFGWYITIAEHIVGNYAAADLYYKNIDDAEKPLGTIYHSTPFCEFEAEWVFDEMDRVFGLVQSKAE